MAFNDPYFAVKAATSSVLNDLEKQRDQGVVPAIELILSKQAKQATSLSVTLRTKEGGPQPAEGNSSSGVIHDDSHRQQQALAVDCSTAISLVNQMEPELLKVRKSLQFIENMLAAIRAGSSAAPTTAGESSGGRSLPIKDSNFTPAEILARQRFYDVSSATVKALAAFVTKTKKICSEVSRGEIPAELYGADCGVTAPGLLSCTNNSAATPNGCGDMPPPPLLAGLTSGTIALQNIRNAARERQLAHERNKKFAEEMHINDNEAFMQAQRELQKDELKVQDNALDRIHFHVGEMKNSVVTIREELESQDVMLAEQMTQTEKLKTKIAATTAQVNHLLENMSDCSKIVTIIVLSMILLLLIVASF